jgi:hypothetical protein
MLEYDRLCVDQRTCRIPMSSAHVNPPKRPLEPTTSVEHIYIVHDYCGYRTDPAYPIRAVAE